MMHDSAGGSIISKQANGLPAKLLTTRELADVLNVSYDTAQRMLRRRQIKSVQIGSSPRNRRVPVAEVDRWISAQLNATAEQRRKLSDRRRRA